MITKDIAVAAKHGTIFYAISERNADGTPLRVRVTGKCQTWVRQPEKFRLPVRHGLKSNGYITERNGHEWAITAAAAIMENTGNSRDFLPRKPLPFAELMTAEDWKQANSSGFLLPGSDGIGYWVRDNYEIEHVTRPCPPGVTHVAWYNN